MIAYFNLVLRDYPMVVNKFLKELSLVEAYQEVVKKDCPKALIREGQEIVVGSDERSPKDFWKKKKTLTGLDSADSVDSTDSLADKSDATPVTAMLLGIPKIASRDSDFLKNAVIGAKKIKRFTAFETDTLEVLIDFKWKTYGRTAFLGHLKNRPHPRRRLSQYSLSQ